MIFRNGSSIKTTVYRKLSHNDVYLHWDSFSPNNWQRKTLKKLLLRAILVCSNEQLLNKEIEHLWNLFHHTNGSTKAINQNNGQSTQLVKITESHQDYVSKSFLLTLPYKEKRGGKSIRNITKKVKRILSDNHKGTLVSTGTKLRL